VIEMDEAKEMGLDPAEIPPDEWPKEWRVTEAVRLHEEGLGDGQIAQRVGVAPVTVQKYLREAGVRESRVTNNRYGPRGTPPPVQLRELLTASRREGKDFEAAWLLALGEPVKIEGRARLRGGAIKWPYSTEDRRQWQVALTAPPVVEAFRLAYEGEEGMASAVMDLLRSLHDRRAQGPRSEASWHGDTRQEVPTLRTGGVGQPPSPVKIRRIEAA
jgi:hypothetical protein